MPIYEYRCTSCGDDFEVLQKMNARPLRKCKKCEGKLEKLVSRTSFQLKGGGWFDSGYSGDTKQADKSGDSSSKSKSKSKASSSSKSDKASGDSGGGSTKASSAGARRREARTA